MKHLELTILASVEPGQPWTQTKLDDLDGKFQHKLMTMAYHGGIKIRVEKKAKKLEEEEFKYFTASASNF